MRSKIQIATGRDIYNNAAFDQWQSPGDFAEICDDENSLRDDARDAWFACVWGDNVLTATHLGDATIHGPFATEEEAIAAFA